MGKWAIVAIPEENDPVWKYSSEKIPHMTLLFLGDQTDNSDLERIIGFTSHVSSTSLSPFWMVVDSRGTLGSDSADVLFFKRDKQEKATIELFRDYLLTDPGILKAYNSTDQFPEWTPHLTMGYPETPAKKDEREHAGFSWVHFDRIALWTGDYSGIDFKLEYPDEEVREVSMSDNIDNFLEHFGVKGMHWGIRRSSGEPVSVSTSVTSGRKVSARGGENQPPHEDAVRTAVSRQKAAKSSTDSLSTKELRELVDRMNLEQQYKKLTDANVSPGRKFVSDILVNTVKQQAAKAINDQATHLVGEAMKRRSAK